MLVTVESTGTLERRMRVELPAERIEKEIESRLKSVGRTAKIKGFRPGKIPAKVVRQRYGGQIRQEVLSDLMQKSYSDAVIQENLNPAGGPKIEPEAVENDKGFAYVATFEVLPEITLQGLDKIAVTKPEIEIADKDCDDMIHNLRKQKAVWSAVDCQSNEGDRVIVDFNGTLKGEPIKGGQGNEVPVVLGEGRMLPDFEKALIGSKAGDEKSIKVKFPKDYHDEELASKKVDFTIKVHRVEEEELPPLDDTLAELYDVKEGGLATLRADVRANMEREAKQRVSGDIKEQALNGLVDANPIEIPNSLKEREIQSLQHEAMRRLGIEDHDKAPPAENFAEAAERRVRLGLLVRQLIQDNNLSVDTDRVRKHVEEMCASYENAEDMVAMYMRNEQAIAQIEPIVLEEQAVEWLTENGVVKTRKAGFQEYMNKDSGIN
jgi:trigger factor